MARLDHDPEYLLIRDFHESFDKLVKNRNVLCDHNGKLLPENRRYYKSYNRLANEVAVKGMKVATDKMRRRVRIPNDDTGSICCKEIEELAKQMRPKFIDILNRGTYLSFSVQIDFLVADAEKIVAKHTGGTNGL